MEAWGRLARAGLVPLELGPPPRALRDPSGTWSREGAGAGAPRAQDPVGCVWEQLWSLRRMDLQLFSQLCALGLEIQALQEEAEADLDEEEEGLRTSPTDWLIPDFEITI
ncbi:glutamate-rich protein 4 isoform X2 [Antechinus flavipes]|uniref:glutamate-rich protein 4 isoform X2 n=1 Tax=Antechinus flavipes TaxID=38775 RepID=UPI0022358F6E|nr:glutamate-rich protein 4 isoform X2 [Antechinus flavipes]